MTEKFKRLDPKVLRQHKGRSFVGVSTIFFCHDGKGKLLMCKRSKNARDEKGRWEVPGGGLKWGVTAMDNVKRELKEEVGAEPIEIELMGYRDVFREDETGKTHWLALDFWVLVDPEQVKINEPEQIDEIGWFTLDNQPSPVHSQHPETLKKYREKLQKT